MSSVMKDPIQSFLSDHDQSASHSLDAHAKCCCGNDACAFLKHNQSALDGLEKDVSTAARLGKALLVRHESYIADSERERKAMTAHIETLEWEKQSLERKNAAVIEENRNLLDQLEAFNNAISESDEHVTSLQTTLQSTQLELQRLQSLASRTERLEQQVADFEREQVIWQSSLEATEQAEKSAVRRWQKAERTLSDLQDQLERIECEAKEEKKRHGEIVERMQRRHTVERELGSAAGRLKGAAALKADGKDAAGTNVVSHFVKDILQDNANLQMGIVELREMLNTSNEEVESLRNQLTLHQPAEESKDSPQNISKRSDLNLELNRANSQELHVHHHYHAPSVAPKTLRRKKKRSGVRTSEHFNPPSGASTPRSSFSYGSPTPMASILQQTAASVPQPVPLTKRWSAQSNQTYHSLLASSGPSSPTNLTSSVFDRVFSDAGHDSSRPTTPDTEDLGSPFFAPTHVKRGSGSSFRTYSAPIVQRRGISPSTPNHPSLDSLLNIEEIPQLEQLSVEPDAIPEENENDWEAKTSPAPEDESVVTSPFSDEVTNTTDISKFYPQPIALRRATSHESIISVSAMDIHTLKARPSQLMTRYGSHGVTSQAAISDTTAHAARPTTLTRSSGGSHHLLSGMAAEQRQLPKSTLGHKVGGWVFGKWGGAAPTRSLTTTDAATTRALQTARPGSVSSASVKSGEDPQTTPKKPKVRVPGINQPGPIFGLGPEVKVTHQPVMKTLDEEGLRRALGSE